jgi:hypothetical protein
MSSTPAVFSQRQMRRMEQLRDGYEVVKSRDGVVILRRPDGQLLRMHRDGRLAPNLTVERVQDYLHVVG